MRTFTVVPSFDGNSAFFELPDIGFQGDNLSFAILFNLTELTDHWPDIVPAIIITDSQGNTYIAPNTSWNASKHLFTWNITNVETAYEGTIHCQLKCTSASDPSVIVCMSQICQTRVYQSLEAAEDPPEAFQTWIDTLVALGSEISADASVIFESVEATQTNARTAQLAADEAEAYKDAAEQVRDTVAQNAQAASNAMNSAVQAQQRAQNSATAAESASASANEAKADAELALEQTDIQASAAAASALSASDSATQATASMVAANTAKLDAQSARDAANTAKLDAQSARDAAVTAQGNAEQVLVGIETARDDAISAKNAAAVSELAAETARTAAETARTAAETARDNSDTFAETSKKWAIGKDKNNQDVSSTDATYHNSSLYWANQSSLSATEANSAKTAILNTQVTSISYSNVDKSITFFIGGNAVSNNAGSAVSNNSGSAVNTDIIQAMQAHISDNSKHVTEEERADWNNQLKYSIDGEKLIFTTNTNVGG